MPINSRDKRTSLITFDWVVGRVLPVPDATISTADRLHFLGKYRGIAASAPPVVTATTELQRPGAWIWQDRRRHGAKSHHGSPLVWRWR